MASITITFADGTPHTYDNVPDTITSDQMEARATQDFAGRKITYIEKQGIAPQQQYNISPEFIRRASISSMRGENPVLAADIDFMTGASGLMRGGANLVGGLLGKEKLGEKIWPSEMADKDSGAYMAGTVADPVAWTGAGAVLKALPYAPVLGKGFVEGTKALAKNVTAGTTIGAGIGGLSEEGTATSGAAIGAGLSLGLPMVLGAFGKAGGWLIDLAQGKRPAIAGGKILRDVVGDKRAQTEAAWKTASDDLTAAQGAGKAGTYELAALGEVSQKYRPDTTDAKLIAQQAGYERTMAGMAGGKTQLQTLQSQQRAGKDLNAQLEPMRTKTLDAANVPFQQKAGLQDALADTNRTINNAWQNIRELQTEGARQSARGAATGVKLPDLPTTGLTGVDAARASQNLSYAARRNEAKSLPFIQGVKRQAHYDVSDSANAAAVEFATTMTQAKGTMAVLEKQIGAMPDPIDVNAIRAAISRQANKSGDSANPVAIKALEGFDNFILKLADKNNGKLDAYDVHGLRKYVNEMVETLFEGADKATKTNAARVLSGLKPAIDAEIKRAAGLQGKRWETWLTKFSEGKHTIDQQKMAAYGLELVQKNTTESKRSFIALVRNNDTEAVENIFGAGQTSFFKEMGANSKPMLDIAKQFERDLLISDRSGKGQLALAKTLERDSVKVRLPALVDYRIGAANKVIDVVESRMNRKALDTVYKAMESPKEALKLIGTLPAGERMQALKLLQAHKTVQSLTVAGTQVSQQNNQ